MAPRREPLRRPLKRVSAELDRIVEVRVRRPLNPEERRRYLQLLAMERLLSVVTVELHPAARSQGVSQGTRKEHALEI